MNSITVDIDITAEKPVTLIPLSDLHIGHAEHNKKLLVDTINYIKNKGAYSILVGDLIDAIAMHDRRYENDSIADEFKPHLDNLHHEQCKSVIKSLTPIKNQILGTLGGNHEATLKKMASYDAVAVIAEGLEIKQLTDPSYMILRFHNGGKSMLIRLWLSHGCFMGGGKFRGSKVNNLEAKAGQFEADIYLSGHTHDRWVTSRTNLVITDRGLIKENRKIFCNTGSFVDSYTQGESDSWVSRSGFPPMTPGCIRIDFYLKRNTKGGRYIDIHARV